MLDLSTLRLPHHWFVAVLELVVSWQLPKPNNSLAF